MSRNSDGSGRKWRKVGSRWRARSRRLDPARQQQLIDQIDAEAVAALAARRHGWPLIGWKKQRGVIASGLASACGKGKAPDSPARKWLGYECGR